MATLSQSIREYRLFVPSHSLAIAAVFSLWLCGCPRDVVATAICDNVEFLESPLGKLNVAQLPIGTLFAVDRYNQKASVVWSVPQPPVLANQYPAESDVVDFADAVDVTLSPSDLHPGTALRVLVQKATELWLTDVSRTSIPDALTVLNDDPTVRSVYAGFSSHHAGLGYYFVYSVVYGSDVQLTVDDALATRPSQFANTVRYGDYILTVHYQCPAIRAVQGKHVAAFVKVMPVAYNTASGRFFVDTEANEDLRGIGAR